jgi:phasin family protein
MRSQKEERMATQSFLDMIKEFGTGLGVPKVDVDKLIETHRKNIDALGHSAQVAGEGAKSLADKQREIIETAFRETSTMVRDFNTDGRPQEMLAKQREFAKKAFEITVQNPRDIAELATKTSGDAVTIIRDRLRESLSEFRDSVRRTSSEGPTKQ